MQFAVTNAKYQTCLGEKSQAYQDHRLACRLGGTNPSQEQAVGPSSEQTDDAIGEASSSSASRSKAAPEESLECEVCYQGVNMTNSACFSCNHTYCIKCIQHLFQESLSMRLFSRRDAVVNQSFSSRSMVYWPQTSLPLSRRRKLNSTQKTRRTVLQIYARGL